MFVVFAATMLVNGAHELARLYPLRLVEVRFPAQPLAWFTALSVLILLVAALVLRILEAQVRKAGTIRISYTLGCFAGVVGLIALALAQDPVSGALAVVLVAATADPIARTVSTIWVNQHANSGVRATMHSFLAQSEYLGEILCGAAISAIAASAGTSMALLFCAGLFAGAMLLARWAF